MEARKVAFSEEFVDLMRAEIEEVERAEYFFLWFSSTDTNRRIVQGKERPHLLNLNDKWYVVNGMTTTALKMPTWCLEDDLHLIGIIKKEFHPNRCMDFESVRESYDKVFAEALENSLNVKNGELVTGGFLKQ